MNDRAIKSGLTMTSQKYRMVCLLNVLEKRLQALRTERPDYDLRQLFGDESQSIIEMTDWQDMRYVLDRLGRMVEDMPLSTRRQPHAA